MAKKRTKAEQAELLNKPIKDFEEQQVVKDLLSDKFVHASDAEASEVTVALAELIRGQKMMTEELVKLRERMSKYDEFAEKWESDKERFLEEVSKDADKLRRSGLDQERIIAQAALDFEREVKRARVEQVSSRLKFEQELASMPKETLTVTGIPETLSRTGQQVIMPEEIRIKHKKWVLQPGVPTEVPKLVADRYREIMRSRAETRERQAALMRQLQDTELAKVMKQIDEKYKSGGDALPIGSTA